jgi:hypothetical protein
MISNFWIFEYEDPIENKDHIPDFNNTTSWWDMNKKVLSVITLNVFLKRVSMKLKCFGPLLLSKRMAYIIYIFQIVNSPQSMNGLINLVLHKIKVKWEG